MITEDEARHLANRVFNPGEHEWEIALREFTEGFVASRVYPPRPDPNSPPKNIGGISLVIDKETGEVSVWPERPDEMIIARYRREPAEKRRILREL